MKISKIIFDKKWKKEIFALLKCLHTARKAKKESRKIFYEDLYWKSTILITVVFLEKLEFYLLWFSVVVTYFLDYLQIFKILTYLTRLVHVD